MGQKMLYGVMRKICPYSELYDDETGRMFSPETGEVLSTHSTPEAAEKEVRERVTAQNERLRGGYFGCQEAAYNELKNTHYYTHPVIVVPVPLLATSPF